MAECEATRSARLLPDLRWLSAAEALCRHGFAANSGDQFPRSAKAKIRATDGIPGSSECGENGASDDSEGKPWAARQKPRSSGPESVEEEAWRFFSSHRTGSQQICIVCHSRKNPSPKVNFSRLLSGTHFRYSLLVTPSYLNR